MRRDAEGLGLVDDEQSALAGTGFLAQPLLDQIEQARLGNAFDGDAETRSGETEHVVAFDLGRDEADRVQPLAVDGRHQMGDEGRLARADLAGDDDEAFALGEPVA
jgi:hypothetical protein